MKKLTLEIDTKKLEQGTDYSLVDTFSCFMTVLGGSYNPMTKQYEIPLIDQKFGNGFFDFLVKAKELGALISVNGLSGCYAKELSSVYQIERTKIIEIDGEEVEEPYWLPYKVSNDKKSILYTFNENDMSFDEFAALKGTLYSNKYNALGQMENYKTISEEDV